MGRHSASGPDDPRGRGPSEGHGDNGDYGDDGEDQVSGRSRDDAAHTGGFGYNADRLDFGYAASNTGADTGSWQRGRRRSGAGNWGLSRGLIAGLATLVVVALAVGLWFYFDKRNTDSGTNAAGTCVHGDNSIAVVADPTIADRVSEFAQRFNKKREPIGDYCFTVSVRPADAANVIAGLTDKWPPALGDQPALWIPGSAVSSAKLKAASKAQLVASDRSLVSTPVLIAAAPALRQAIPPAKGWADLPALQDIPNSLDEMGLPGWGSLRLLLPSSGNADAPLLAGEAVAAATVHPGEQAEVGAGAVSALVAAAPKLPANGLSDAMAALLDQGARPDGAVHAVVTTEQQLFARTRNNSDAASVVAAWQPAGATPMADYPVVQLQGPWLSDEQQSAASQFTHFLRDPEQLKDLASDGFRAENTELPSSAVVAFAKVDNPLTLDEKARVALAGGSPSATGAATTTIMLGSSFAADNATLADVTAALSNRLRGLGPASAVGLWTYDGKEGATQVRTGGSADDVQGVPRTQSIIDTLSGLPATSNGAVAFTTLRNVYAEAVNAFRPDQVNSVLIIAGHSHTDQTLDGAGLIDTINRQKDPARPVRINVIDFGDDSDQPTWRTLAETTGGAYQNLSASNTPELAAAIVRFLS